MLQPMILEGNNGELNTFICYHQDGEVVICEVPMEEIDQDPGYLLSATSKELMQQAHLYGISVICSPVLKAIYEMKAGPGSSAYLEAVSEYLENESSSNIDL